MRVMRAVLPVAATVAALLMSGCSLLHPQAHSADPAAVAVVTPESAAADASASKDAANAGAKTVQSTSFQKFLWFFSPYRPDIQQGNFISQEMLTQLKVGQTREQVRFVLGTPLLTDVFHEDRWDFPFYLQRGSGELTTSRVSVYFKDNKVERIDGGNLPTEREYIERIAGKSVMQLTAPKKPDTPPVSIQVTNDAK